MQRSLNILLQILAATIVVVLTAALPTTHATASFGIETASSPDHSATTSKCLKLKAPQPRNRQCNGATSTPPASNRQRSSDSPESYDKAASTGVALEPSTRLARVVGQPYTAPPLAGGAIVVLVYIWLFTPPAQLDLLLLCRLVLADGSEVGDATGHPIHHKHL